MNSSNYANGLRLNAQPGEKLGRLDPAAHMQGINLDAKPHGAGQGDGPQINAFARCRLELNEPVNQTQNILLQLLATKEKLTNNSLDRKSVV